MPGNKKNKRKSAQTKKHSIAGNQVFKNPNTFNAKSIKSNTGKGVSGFSPKPQRKSSQRGR